MDTRTHSRKGPQNKAERVNEPKKCTSGPQKRESLKSMRRIKAAINSPMKRVRDLITFRERYAKRL